ncbi:hypothetical protein M8C21_029561 [Ambrosia artemisiifolia]|uniref:MADS-box domain-containing protein n=1 Tax=Ambrosia artemisiifolia TaxID=4212 RepID=A0AAD5BLR5_AMBAR|nr:hypothetical protein M8C21_029561 [Ambrosia artemisiifolia]
MFEFDSVIILDAARRKMHPPWGGRIGGGHTHNAPLPKRDTGNVNTRFVHTILFLSLSKIMVRSKIDLKYIEDVQRRRVCFSKRRTGLMKKAHELSVLCNADIGVIVFSATGRLYEFASSSIQQIIRRYITTTGAWPDDASHLLAQRAEEIRNLKKEVLKLESENMSLRKDLEEAVSNNQRIAYDNSNMETALTLRLPR